MATTRCARWLLLAIALWVTFNPQVDAQNITATERRMSLLLDNAQRLTVEINAHYRQVPQFGKLSAESSKVCALSSQVVVCLQSGDITQATRDLCEVERLARHIQDDLDSVDDLSVRGRVPRAYRVNTRQAFRTAQFVEDYAVDLKDDIRDLPRRGLPINVYAQPYAGKSVIGNTYRAPPVLENPRPQSLNYPPASPPLPAPGQLFIPGPAPGPGPAPAPEILPEPRGVPLQAPGNANPPAIDRET